MRDPQCLKNSNRTQGRVADDCYSNKGKSGKKQHILCSICSQSKYIVYTHGRQEFKHKNTQKHKDTQWSVEEHSSV